VPCSGLECHPPLHCRSLRWRNGCAARHAPTTSTVCVIQGVLVNRATPTNPSTAKLDPSLGDVPRILGPQTQQLTDLHESCREYVKRAQTGTWPTPVTVSASAPAVPQIVIPVCCDPEAAHKDLCACGSVDVCPTDIGAIATLWGFPTKPAGAPTCPVGHFQI
jgi:hypothetical protein